MLLNARAKGHTYELRIVNEWKKLTGNDEVWTSRNMSRIMDNLKVDLVGTDPFYIQCKALETAINAHAMLYQEMPQKKHFMNSMFHKRGKKEVVSLKEVDFHKIVRLVSRGPVFCRYNAKSVNVHKFIYEDIQPSGELIDVLFIERPIGTVVFMKKKGFYELLKGVVVFGKWEELE